MKNKLILICLLFLIFSTLITSCNSKSHITDTQIINSNNNWHDDTIHWATTEDKYNAYSEISLSNIPYDDLRWMIDYCYHKSNQSGRLDVWSVRTLIYQNELNYRATTIRFQEPQDKE